MLDAMAIRQIPALGAANLASRLPRWWLPTDASAHGPALDQHLILNLWIAMALIALVHAILLVGLLGRRSQSRRPAWAVEYLPLGLVTLLFIGLTIRAEQLWAISRYTGASPAALQVEATGMQFVWYFRYPGTDAAFGRVENALVAPGEGNPVGLDPADARGHDDLVTAELVLPANREVDLRLRAVDVIHGFAVPELRLKQNAVPGQTLHLHFTPTRPGTYAVLCTQLCGSGHYRMQANLRVLSQEDFQTWLKAREAAKQSAANTTESEAPR